MNPRTPKGNGLPPRSRDGPPFWKHKAGRQCATGVVKLLLGKGELLMGRLLLYDALNMTLRELKIRRDPACPVCGDAPTITSLVDYQAFCGVSSQVFDDEIEPVALQAMLCADEQVVLIDVREPHEREINRIEGSLLLPLRDLPARVQELNPEADIVAHCLMGARSAEACRFLRSAGFAKVRNLRGGIRAWVEQVDPEMANY